eukprot:TRINITY_DN13419_c0_g1_i1.p1 TRINITY_DN13419_c0_g1~~TRINITY_DN13419_c0_g1_i1.p1  ORF type:complete len:461 (-),score=131.64 TRINITY_DN13419_c0_g1_i1:117-1499(-)
MRKGKKDKEDKKEKKESKKNLKVSQVEAAKPVEAKKETASSTAPVATGAKTGRILLSSYENWNKEKWSLAGAEIIKGLRAWNFKMEPMKVRLPIGNTKKYIFEDCWVTLHLEFILIWRNHLDRNVPPPAALPPDEFLPLGKYNPKFVEVVTGRTQKDSFIGERLLKFENTFRVGTQEQEYMFELSNEESMNSWMNLVTETITSLLKSRKYFAEKDPDATWEEILKDVPISYASVLRDPLKEGEEEEWINKVVKIKEGYEKNSEAVKRLKCWSRYFKDETQFYMEWMSAPVNSDHGVGRELVNAQERVCEKWKHKFHDFKALEKHFPELHTMSHSRRDKIILYTEKMIGLCDLYSKYFLMLNKRESPYGNVKKKWETYKSQIEGVKESVLAAEEQKRKDEEKARKREVKEHKRAAKEMLAEQAKQNQDPFSDVNVFRNEDPFGDVFVDPVVDMYGDLGDYF